MDYKFEISTIKLQVNEYFLIIIKTTRIFFGIFNNYTYIWLFDCTLHNMQSNRKI